jgi:hypothetical protein
MALLDCTRNACAIRSRKKLSHPRLLMQLGGIQAFLLRAYNVAFPGPTVTLQSIFPDPVRTMFGTERVTRHAWPRRASCMLFDCAGS